MAYKLIGIHGEIGHGKDTVANILRDKLGYNKMAFADELRECLLLLNPLMIVDNEAVVPLKDLVRTVGWEYSKRTYPAVRQFMQTLATDVVRNRLGDDLWVKAAMKKVRSYENTVFCDVRFPNEAQAILDKDGILVKIHNPNVAEETNGHSSESYLKQLPYRYAIVNDGDILDLEDKVLNTFIYK